jgi:glucose dehydrogenase
MPVGKGPSQDDLLRAASDTRNWLSATKDYAGQRFIDLNQINAGNAARLRPVCIYRSNNANPTQTNPVVYNGVMYLTVDQSIVAIDAVTCRER